MNQNSSVGFKSNGKLEWTYHVVSYHVMVGLDPVTRDHTGGLSCKNMQAPSDMQECTAYF